MSYTDALSKLFSSQLTFNIFLIIWLIQLEFKLHLLRGCVSNLSEVIRVLKNIVCRSKNNS